MYVFSWQDGYGSVVIRTGTLQLPGIVPRLARYHGNWLSVLG